MEQWKDIKGYEGLYQVSNMGVIRSLYTGKILKAKKETNGYMRVKLYKDGKGKSHTVHRIVAEHFIPNPYNLPQVNHKNEIKTDNRVENLEWCDAKYNLSYNNGQRKRADKNTNGKCSKIVLQYTLDGVFIAEYPSTHEVQRQLGYYNGHISECCRGERKQRFGFVWRYKEGVN